VLRRKRQRTTSCACSMAERSAIGRADGRGRVGQWWLNGWRQWGGEGSDVCVLPQARRDLRPGGHAVGKPEWGMQRRDHGGRVVVQTLDTA